MMREPLVMSGNREGQHTERNGEANWERILNNITRKAVFDAVGVVL